MNPFDVILRPIISEKSTILRDKMNVYTFDVLRTASKDDIKLAVEKMFSVNVRRIRTCITRGKVLRRGMRLSMQPKRKKALIYLGSGQKISLFEEQSG